VTLVVGQFDVVREEWEGKPVLYYVPKGRKADDGRIDEKYQLVELSSNSYSVRTKRNIRESDGTVLFSLDKTITGGSALTLSYARNVNKPIMHIHDGKTETDREDALLQRTAS
jgi:hypothetical protein